MLATLCVPGIVDVHVHAMPDRMMSAVWAVFDRAREVYGMPWPIRYRGSDDTRREYLASIGVRRHTTLSYAHRPGVAAGLNAWSLAYAQQHPQVVPSATFYPESAAGAYVSDALATGAAVFKIHVDVGDFDVNDPLLEQVWGLVSEAGATVVAHVGSAPLPARFSGPVHLERLLRRHPRLRVIVAHFGLPETAEFLDLADRYDGVGLDTTMVGTDFMEHRWPLDRALLPRVRELGMAGRVFFGSDYPNIPYPYAHQVQALVRWDLGEAWLREVLWAAGARRFPAGE
jgi:predicted TIM-barrel fold metal-dependent hydrolase